MKTKLLYLLIAIIFTSCLTSIYAVRATPYPITITQIDGTELTIRLHGNEFSHYKTTLDGYLLTKDSKGIYNYAETDKKGNILNTGIKASNFEKRTLKEKELLARIKPNVDISKTSRIQKSLSSIKSSAPTAPREKFPLIGTPKSLVILVNFKDVSFVTSNPKTAFTDLLNQSGYSANGGTGSARDYFYDNSMGVFSPEFDVVGPFNLPDSMSFYGKNLSNDDDANPRQMVIDACTLAANSGIDFSQYDINNDGYVDNIFIYYAGYNEAEGASDNTIWPHRWTLSNTNTRFNGKIIFDYACTSELRGRTGNNMCGIGTFVHEFSHVLGLVDYYPTDNATHHTLSYWHVMDAGPYLNNGRTPPAYSAYDRFFLDWLEPTELLSGGNYSLDTLTTSNKAYLITQYGNHNLNGANPSPVEFFTLENRQKSGWDTYLPGHGMLISRIFYNATTWSKNEPNNDPNAMGVDIIEADGLASNGNLAGDPFPGSKFVNTYTPTLRSGIELSNKLLSQINETNGIITFHYMNGEIPKLTPPEANDATDITIGSFIANWDIVPAANGYYLTIYNISDGISELRQGFDPGTETPNGWTITSNKRTTSKLYSGKEIPAVQLSNSAETIVTEEYILPVAKCTFYIRSLGGSGGFVSLEGKSESVWISIDTIGITESLNEIKSYTFDINKNYTQFRLTYTKVKGDVAIDDITAHFSQNLEFNKHEVWTTAIADTLMNLIPNRMYYYKVRASNKQLNADKSILFENISEFSEKTIQVKTLENRPGNIFRVQSDGSLKILIPTTKMTVRIFNLLGQLVREIMPDSNIISVEELPKNQFYIIEADVYRAKIIL
jgi:M6 family metalloprotease-like protein